MYETDPQRVVALAALNVLVGEWMVEVQIPSAQPGRMTIIWALNGQYLVQRSSAPDPMFPSSLSIIAYDGAGAFTQHYFDSRGVVRLYSMTLGDSVWTLERARPDFSPLDFWQRFEERISADGSRIDGHWEQSHDQGAHWDLDFALTYTRLR